MTTSITQSSRFVAMTVAAAMIAALAFGGFSAPAHAALSASQISSILSLLQSFGADQATINNVQASLNGQATPGTGTGSGGACPALSRDLLQGSTGADVMALQKFLNTMTGTIVALTGAGSPGNETSTFGSLTKAAVIKFQTLYNITPIAGYAGAKTRAQIASVCGGTSSVPGVPSGPGLSVSANAQPANALAPQGASRVPFTNLMITNNSGVVQTVSSITVQRTGFGVDANFSGITLLDSNGLQIGTAKTLNSNHQANIGDSWTINPGETKTLTVAGNIATGQTTGGQIVSLQVVAINSTAAISGSLPIIGASHTINTTLTLGSFSTSTSAFDPGTAQTKSIGDSGVRFTGIRLTAGAAEDLKFYSIRWRQVGTASASDVANVMTVVNDISYPTTVSADGKYYTTVFTGGLMVAKGNSIDVYAKGDLIGSNSSSRTIDFDIDRSTDLYFVGQTYGYGVADTVYPTAQPWLNGFITTIQAGTATTIGKATTVIAQNIAVNVQNQPLGGFVTDFKGEAVSIQGMFLTVSTTTGTAAPTNVLPLLLTNVSIVDSNGAVVAGPVDMTGGGGAVAKLTFGDTITFPTGSHVYTIKGKVASATPNGTSVLLSTTPSGWTNPQGQTSGSTVSLASNGVFSMNVMTVKAAALAVGMSATPSSQAVTAGSSGVIMANIQLDASQSGEDVRVTSLPIVMTLGGSSGAVADISSCQLYNGSAVLNSGSNVPSLAADTTATTFVLDNSLTITKGTVVTLALKCNIASGAASTATYTFSVVGSSFTSTGINSGNGIVETGTGSSGTFSIGNASLAVSVDSSSPSYAIAAGGTTGQTMAVYKFRATNDNVNLTKLGLTLTTSADLSGRAQDLVQVYIKDGATIVGTATFLGGAVTATSTLSSTVTLTKDTDKTLTITADLADIGTSQSGSEGALIKINANSAEGNASSGLVQSPASAGVAGVRVLNSFPTVALDTVSTTGVAEGTLMRFKVTANAAGSIGLHKFTFVMSTTTLKVSQVSLKAYTDASYSSPVSDSIGDGSGQINTTLATSTSECLATYDTPALSNCRFASGATTYQFRTATNALQVPAGTTRYFELRGSVTGSIAGASVITTLSADASFATSTALSLSAIGGTNSKFVWSPNATSTQAITNDTDWTTGYTLPGLPASGLTQTRAN
jgi:hypothetical protein